MGGLVNNWFQPVMSAVNSMFTIFSNAASNINQTITFNVNNGGSSVNFQPGIPMFTEEYYPPIWVQHVDPDCVTCGKKCGCVVCNGIMPTGYLPCSCTVKSTGLSTGPGYYNPSMLNRGNNDEKLARRKAIEFRNLMLGDEGCRALYSPDGLCVRSKIWPDREYRFYAHHVSAQVYDYGENVGRLDVHSDVDVPAGDTHLAAILKTMFDEEDMVKISYFSRVRDI